MKEKVESDLRGRVDDLGVNETHLSGQSVSEYGKGNEGGM